MIVLALSAIIASTPAIPVSAKDQPAVDRCRARLAARLGDLGSFEVATIDRHGRTMIVRGAVNQLERPATAPPGVMTPTHVLATGYAFRCELRSGRLRRMTLARQ